MRRDECGFMADVSEHDRAEVEKFTVFMERRRDQPQESERDAYAAVYGEVVYPRRTPGGKGP